ncbi:MurR/RpiR family transcriptional regulator [Clostridiaceae bacterium M8S5]|nr:MurR/RpiR family transcriptional regulator [Clostridiaceae bacterium M8S5]
MNLKRLVENYDSLTINEKRIVEYIMNNPKKVVHLTANELAAKVFISKTSIINFSKKLGFEGFSELRYYLKEFVTSQEAKIERLSYQDMTRNLQDELNKTLALQSEENIKVVAEKIINAKTIYIVARGASRHVGTMLNSRLSILKLKSIFIEDINLIDVIGERLTENEALVLISLSGETEIIKNVANIARAKGIDVIALTSFSNNSLQKIANYKMFCFADEIETKHNDLIPRLGLHAVAQLLIMYISMYEKE